MINFYDVIVVGGGASGLAVAAASAEKGLRVLVLEKGRHTGGPVGGGMGMFAIQSRQQQKAGVTFDKKEVMDFLMQHSHYKTDGRIVSTFVENCTPALEWLERLGVQFQLCSEKDSIHFRSWHTVARPGPGITECLEKDFLAHGGEILLESVVTGLWLENDAVVGVTAVLNGQETQIRSRTVVLATGGCANSEEMIRQHTSFEPGKNYFMFGAGSEGVSSCGEGLQLAWDAGAKKSDIVMDTYICLPGPYGGGGGTCAELRLYHEYNLMVNCQGERVVNEEIFLNGAFAGNVAIRQPDGALYGVVSEDIAEAYEEDCRLHPPMTPFGPAPACTPFREFFMNAVEKEQADCLFVADSVEELAEKIGADPLVLQKTLDEYNTACNQGKDEKFFKDPQYLKPIQGKRYYAARFLVTAYGSFGGIVINENGQVLNTQGSPIPGLFCTGMDANCINADSYTHQMTGSTSGFNYAMALVESSAIAEVLKKA